MKNKNKNKKSLKIGQTLETEDRFLPFDKRDSKELKSSRPVIIAGKQKNSKGIEEYSVLVGSTKETRNTFKYGKYGIKNIRNNIEIEDNDKKPIMLNKKFKLTKNCSVVPKDEVVRLYDKVVNHTRFSSENRKKDILFNNRYKLNKDSVQFFSEERERLKSVPTDSIYSMLHCWERESKSVYRDVLCGLYRDELARRDKKR